MGAATFTTRARGKTADRAFHAAVKQAQYDHGHSGYTGTIAEKHSFIEMKVPDGIDPTKYADDMIDDPRIEDKWGPAGCVRLRKDEWLFFGWASS